MGNTHSISGIKWSIFWNTQDITPKTSIFGRKVYTMFFQWNARFMNIESDICVFCQSDVESLCHLLLHCPFATICIHYVTGINTHSFNCIDTFWIHIFNLSKHHYVPLTPWTMYHIWLLRNNIMFKQSTFYPANAFQRLRYLFHQHCSPFSDIGGLPTTTPIPPWSQDHQCPCRRCIPLKNVHMLLSFIML